MASSIAPDEKSHVKKVRSLLNPCQLILISIFAGVLLVLLRVAPLITLPYQIDYGEGLMLDGADRIWHSFALYPNPYDFPVVIHDFGPVAYAAVAAILPGGSPSLPAGRVLILCCSLLLSLLIGQILKLWTRSWWSSLPFGLILLTLPAFRFWFYLVRADVIGILFSIVGVALYFWKEKLWYWSVLFFGLAVFCKYTLIAAPLSLVIHLILNRKWKQGVILFAAFVVECMLAFGLLQFITHGWFAFHMFSTHSDRYSLVQFFALAAVVWASAPVVTGFALWYVAQDFRSHRKSFAAIYFVAASITALSAGKLGSTINHFLEWMVASCLCAGLGYAVLISKYRARLMPATVLLSASVLMAVIVQNRPQQQPTSGLTECREAYQYIRESPSPRVLSESLAPLLMAKKPVFVSDLFVFAQLAKHGLWPNREVEKRINTKYFGLIVMSKDPAETKLLDSDLWPESITEPIRRNYRTVNRFNCRGAGIMLEPAEATEVAPGLPVVSK